MADITDAAGMETVATIEVEGGTARFVHTDVTDSAEVAAMVFQTVDTYGGVDILVNNAYFCDGDDILTVDEELWNRNIRGCLSSAFLCCKAVLPHMIDQGKGAIVNIASVNGLLGLGEEAYSAQLKAGVIFVDGNIAVRYGELVPPNSICRVIQTPAWQADLRSGSLTVAEW